jgi:hypothetical protein
MKNGNFDQKANNNREVDNPKWGMSKDICRTRHPWKSHALLTLSFFLPLPSSLLFLSLLSLLSLSPLPLSPSFFFLLSPSFSYFPSLQPSLDLSRGLGESGKMDSSSSQGWTIGETLGKGLSAEVKVGTRNADGLKVPFSTGSSFVVTLFFSLP